jgi:penicillin-binding protein 1A
VLGRARPWALGTILLAAGLLATLLLKSWCEARLQKKVEAEAARYGLVAHVEGVRIGFFPPLLLRGLSLQRGRLALRAESAALSLRLGAWGIPVLHLAIGPGGAALPGGLRVEVEPTVWKVARGAGAVSGTLREPVEGLIVSYSAERKRMNIRLDHLRVPSLARLLVNDVPTVDIGAIDGELNVGPAKPGEITGDGRVAAAGVAVAGTIVLAGTLDDPRLGLDFRVERVDLARLLATSGLGLPAGAEDLGTVALQARFTGRLSDPASFVVSDRLDFVPPRTPIPAVGRLKADFVHEIEMPDGTRRAIEVSPSSPDFIPLSEVPPLFVRTLLLAEDAGFFGHRGLDLSEVPVALAKNWAQGSPARGASTLTQQLAKNLFLSREKSLGRKLQELALTLLLESALGKNRILEIYLNIIEWGPGIYGLRPAARHYFGKEPRDLSAKEMAFLVALIPGPIKYQRSFAGGELSPGFEPMVTHLLSKLRSVGALSEAEYEAAREERLVFRPPEPPGP